MLSRHIVTLGIALLASTSAVAFDLQTLKGSWVCQSGCSCRPASPERFASVRQEGFARNECGAATALTVSQDRLQAREWGIGANVSPDGTTLKWDNGSTWVRLPSELPELERRVAYWESRTFYCASPSGAFPSKEAEGGAPACDDGDSVMFNALLCRAGDPRGCNSIRLSQDDDGRFWRSPEKRRLRPDEPSGLEKGETTFSGDHAAGLFVYFGHTRDADAFGRWVKWIDANEKCFTLCTPAAPRYCKNDRCAFRVGDCQTLILLGARLNVGVPFCSPDPIAPIPTATSVARALKSVYDETLGKFRIQPPELKLLRDNFDGALRAYENAVAPIEQLRTKIHAEAVRTLMLTQIEEALSARFNARGYSRHNALVQIMMLQDWGLGKSWMSREAERVALDEPLNPFFQYVAHRRSNKASMLPLILEECPAEATDPRRLRRQWSWERDTAKKEWVDTMYWDCLFIAAMYAEKGGPPRDDDSTERALRTALDEAIKHIGEVQKKAEASLKQIADLEAKLRDPAKAAGEIIEQKKNEAVDAIQKPSETIQKKADELREMITRPDKTLRRLSPF